MKRLLTVLAGLALPLALLPPAMSGAGSDTKVTLFPVNETDQLETHTWVQCTAPGAPCIFTAGVQLRTPDGAAGFPPDLWARQSTEVRSTKRSTYLDVHADGGPFTKVFKEGGPDTVTTIYNGAGPPEKYQTNGTIDVVDWATGQPNPDAVVIVCAHVQVVYAGVNLTTPSTCAKTTFG